MATNGHFEYLADNRTPETFSNEAAAASGPRKPPRPERLLNAREVAAELGVSERWVRDHTTRRNPMIRGVKLGSLIRYKRADVDAFMESLATDSAFSQRRVRA